MVSGDSGAGAVGLEAFRQLLGRAAEEDESRSAALSALCERSVLAATWSEAGDKLRTLSNRDGEQGMPLFTDSDTLRSAAQRFNWAKSGPVGMRQLSARDAMQSALTQGVQFIVIDVGAEHCVEFARDEVALMLAAKQRQRPIGGNAGQPLPPTAERTRIEAPRAAAPAQPNPRAQGIQLQLPAAANQTMPGHGFEGRPSFDAVPAFEAPRPAAPRPLEAPRARDIGSLPLAPSLHEPAIDAQAGLGFSYGDPEPEARPAALEAAVMVAQIAKQGDAATQKAAAEVAAMLKQMAVKGVDETAKPAKGAAKAFAAMLTAELQASEKKKPSTTSFSRVDPNAQADAPAAEASGDEAASEDEELPEEPVYEEGALRPLQVGLSDALQQSIAESLRSFPEVEWACEVSDGTETPVIGVRVSPSFLTRAADIEKAILKAAAARRVSLRVLLLNEPGQMREARSNGNTFFPWRKRPARK